VTNIRKVTVFGGTGFLGRRVVQHLLDHGFAVRVASRHPERGAQVFSNTSSALELVRADVGDDGSVMTAVAGTFGVVNAVSLYVERGNQTFRSVHVEAAARVAKHSRALGVQRLAHVSGIGADARSWQGLAFVAEMMPAPPVTKNQVELMAVDNVASSTHPGFRALGIDPRGIEVVLASARLNG